ncbi:Cardiolipin synthase (CMP-forming), mitochondrial [Capsicum baccatum]|uniref:Cardiolipin synthase (CMP-forming), mitochondrial n=1 Tax=Capsicum baccatum TaxID=33114 RepID=A0A2G2VSF0_CAPBA|nr:Cardiolipin synthase (CMP-forming), mitochondrial [Capsicum baccatum]
MTIFKSIQALISRNRKFHSNSLTSSRTFSSSTIPLTPLLNVDPFVSYRSRRHFLFRPSFLSPLTAAVNFCPLFLSSPPCKLSQSATSLHLQSDFVLVFPGVSALRLQLPTTYKLCFESTPRRLEKEKNDKQWKESSSQLAVEVRDSFLNLPNLISLSRMISGPFLAWMIIHDMYLPALVGLAVSGATDWLDGFMARRMRINSVVGSYLDPLADKVLIAFVALAMVDKGLLHPGLVSLVVLRDVALVGGAVYKRASILEWKWSSWYEFFNLDGARPQKVEPLFISKVNTVLQLALVAAALLQPDLGNAETQTYITYLSWLVAMTTVGSTVAYGAQHLRSGATLKNRL